MRCLLGLVKAACLDACLYPHIAVDFLTDILTDIWHGFFGCKFWFRESWVLILYPFNQPCHLKSEYPPPPLGLQASSQRCLIFIFPCLPPLPPKRKKKAGI